MTNARRIAVIEGDQLVRELVRRWLGDARHVVELHSVSSTIGAVDLIVADVANPRAASPLLVRLLQTHSNIPVLLLSARFRAGQGGSVQLATELGVAAVLPKPFTQRQLLAAVRQSLTIRGKARSQPRSTSTRASNE
jgi:DNA-binding response OmpR family regulator